MLPQNPIYIQPSVLWMDKHHRFDWCICLCVYAKISLGWRIQGDISGPQAAALSVSRLLESLGERVCISQQELVLQAGVCSCAQSVAVSACHCPLLEKSRLYKCRWSPYKALQASKRGKKICLKFLSWLTKECVAEVPKEKRLSANERV